VKWQKIRMRTEDIAWIEEASRALEMEPIELGFLEEALVVEMAEKDIGYD
jgi:hypothetical protein